VHGQGQGRPIGARLLNSRGELVAVQMGVVSTRGAYGRDGAAIVLSRCAGETAAAKQPGLLRQVR
jgi:hypothetical protein